MSDSDRLNAVERLRDACVEGRLTIDELSERIEAAYAARTIGDLAPTLGDIASTRRSPETLASWPLRAAALLVDGCIVTGASAVVGLPFGALGWSVWPLVSTLLLIPLWLAYFTTAHGSERGQTVGDWVNRIAVKSDPLRAGVGGRASYGQAFGRAVMVGVFLGLFLFGGALDFLWPLWDRRRQAWHDKVAGTIVVRSYPPE